MTTNKTRQGGDTSMTTIHLTRTHKQKLAWEILNDTTTTEILYGGGA